MIAQPVAHAIADRSHHRIAPDIAPNRPTRPDPSRPILVTAVCGSRWSISESEVTVTKGRGIGFGMGQNR